MNAHARTENRYERFEHDADRNLGTDELGLRRFTRASERIGEGPGASNQETTGANHSNPEKEIEL